MGLIQQLGMTIALGDTALESRAIEREARRLLTAASPWRVDELAGQVPDHVLELGPLSAILSDSQVSDVVVNGAEEVWIDRGNGLERSDRIFGSDDEIVSAIERTIAPLGLRIDRSAPVVDARLADGSRLHAVIPPAAVDGPHIAIRRFTQVVESVDDLVATGTATSAQAERLAEAVARGEAMVISGGTGSGKTTLLNILAGCIPSSQRTVTIEDAAELRIPGHVVRLEARPPNAEGEGEITVRDLLKSALRLRPDRIILGEVRGSEAFDLVTALNTGHRGSMTTVHSNGPEQAMWKLATLALAAGETSELAVTRQLSEAVDLVVQIDRGTEGRRITAVKRPMWS